MAQFNLLLILLTLCVLQIRDSHQSPDEKRLFETLFNKREYNKLVRPTKTADESLEVKFGISLQQIEFFDVNKESLRTNVWLNYEWKDSMLAWNTDEYGGVKSIRLPSNMIWIPDIMPYNAITTYVTLTDIVVYSDGTASWVPMATYETSCAFNPTDYPYDDQYCQIKFGSWTYDGSKVNLTSRSDMANVDTYMMHNEWDLIDAPAKLTTLQYDCCPEPYIDLTFTLHLKRHSSSKALEVFFPPALLSLVSLLSFAVPVSNGERITLSVIQLVAMGLFWERIATETPHSTVLTLIDCFYGTMFFGSFVAFLLTILVLNVYNSRGKMPNRLRALTNTLADSLCCAGLGESTGYGNLKGDGQALFEGGATTVAARTGGPMGDTAWRTLAGLLDRVFFILYLIFFMVACLCILT